MIASIGFRNFKALRDTHVELTAFNLIIGPNGSGKTSLIEALLRLKTLAQDEPCRSAPAHRPDVPELEFHFMAPYEDVIARIGCSGEHVCDALTVEAREPKRWSELCRQLGTIRSYVLEHPALAQPAARVTGHELASNGSNLAAVLLLLRERAPDAFAELTAELLRIAPEFKALELAEHADGRVTFGLELVENGIVAADELSQGTLYLLGVLALAYDPDPPAVLCIEEVDRGIHPRKLRDIRDAFYRLSYPRSFGLERRPVQIVTTSHSPYFIDLFRDHPEEIVISEKHGRAAVFSRLGDRADLPELLREGSLGDMWFSGILGGVPEER